MQTKKCTKCYTDKPLSDYYTLTNKKTGRQYTYSYCKKCHYEKMTKHTAAKWRKDNPDAWLKAVHKAQTAYFLRQPKGVYLLNTNKGMYVGSSDKLTSRIHQHKNTRFKGNVGYKGAKILSSRILVEEQDRTKRLKLEKEWIKKLQPELNMLHTDKYKTFFQLNPNWKKERL